MKKSFDQFRPKNLLTAASVFFVLSNTALAEESMSVDSQEFFPKIENTLSGTSDSLKTMKKVNKIKEPFYDGLKNELLSLPQEFDEVDSVMFCPQLDTITNLYSLYENSCIALLELKEENINKIKILEEKKVSLRKDYMESVVKCDTDEEIKNLGKSFNKSVEKVDEEIRGLRVQEQLTEENMQESRNNVYDYLQNVAPDFWSKQRKFDGDMAKAIADYNNEKNISKNYEDIIKIPELISILGEVLSQVSDDKIEK